MAFCDFKPVRVYDDGSSITYVIGEVFAVYGSAPVPVIYSWDQVQSVIEDRRSLTIKTEHCDFVIPKNQFANSDDYFRAIAIIEYFQKTGGFVYEHQRRILPLKSDYIETDPGRDCYTGTCEIDENDAASTFVMLMNYKLIKVLWLLAIIMMLVIFLGLHLIFGITRENILYFIPISVIGGGIVTLLIYLICYLNARRKYTAAAGCDPASQELITFTISPLGFSACETCLYDGQELIPWNSFDYFIESDKMFVLFKDGTASVFIPKSAFEKKSLGGIYDIISLRLEQR